jgi:hypothetical protein
MKSRREEMRNAYTILVGKSDHLGSLDIDGIIVRGCIQKFSDWSPEARTASGTALCH